jgi:hypothetical protein
MEPYDYAKAGFDAFLSRSIDNLSQVNLNSQGPQSNSMAYDRSQVTGYIGDTLQIGKVHINRDNITLEDEDNTRLVIGEDEGFE